MRHTVTLEFMNEVKVHDKLLFFNAVSAAKDLNFTDITSASRDEVITAYFTTEDNDEGRIIFEGTVMKISVLLSFERLVDLSTFTETHYGEEIIDLLRAENEEGYPPVEEDEPLITA